MDSQGAANATDDGLLRKLQRQNRILSAAVVLNLLISAAVATRLLSAPSQMGTEHIATRSVSLTDSRGHVVAEIGSTPGTGNDSDLYRPFVKFWDRGKDPVLTLYGTGLNLIQGDQSATYNFLGFSIYGKDSQFLGNNQMIAYSAKGGSMMIFPTDGGMDMTIASFAPGGRENSIFGVLAQPDESSMYVAANGNEADVNATRTGTSIVRGKSR